MLVKRVKGRDGVAYVYTVESYRDSQGRSRQRTVEAHGRLDVLLAGDPEALGKLKARAKALTAARETGRGSIPYDTSARWDGGVGVNLGWLLADAALARLGAVERAGAARRRHGWPEDADSLLRLLVCSRVVWPGSKLETWRRQAELFAGPEVPDWRQVYRGLDRIASLAESLQAACRRALGRGPEALAVVDYDVTNYFFAVDQDDPEPEGPDAPRGRAVRRRGHSKEPRPDPIIQMGLFLDQSGLPVCYRLFDGSVPDVSTLQTALPEFKRLSGCRRVVVVADKAMNARDNLGLLRQGGDGWIVSASCRNGKKELKDWLLDPADWTAVCDAGGDVLSKTKSRTVVSVVPHVVGGVTGTPTLVEEKQVARWSRDGAARDALNRAEALAKAGRLAADPARFKASNRRGVKKHVQTSRADPATGEILPEDPPVLSVDWRRAEAEARFDGYQLVRTSETGLADQAVLARYRQLWRIEQTFRVSKTSLRTRPVFVRTPQHIEAHFAVCFLALLVTRLLEQWTGLPAERLLRGLRSLAAVPVGPGLFRLQRTPEWDQIDQATGVPLDQSWATVEQLRAWRRGLRRAARTACFPTSSDTPS